MRKILPVILSALLLIMCGCGQKTVNYISDTYETSTISVSMAAFPDGSQNVVVSSDSQGIALWSGTAFAGIIDAPVLLYGGSGAVNSEIERLGAKNVYVFGNFDYTAPAGTNCVRFSSMSTVTEDAAKYLRESLGINYDSAFLVTSNEEAAAVCSQAYKNKIPILLVSKKIIPDKIMPYLAPVRNYLVGKEYRNVVIDPLGSTFFQIFGDSAIDLSGFANNMFDADAEGVVLINEPIEFAISAPLAKAKNAAVMLYNGELFVSQQKFMHSRSTDNIYTFGAANDRRVEKFTAECDVLSRDFDTFKFDGKYKRAIFYIPHQDDETLFYSQLIVKAVDAFGPENVSAVLITNGSNSSTKNVGAVAQGLDSIFEYTQEKLNSPLSEADELKLKSALFSHARDNEFNTALASFGIPKENIRFVGMDDGDLTEKIADISAVMAQYKDDKKLLHFTLTPYYEAHEDHAALGTALMNTLGYNAENAYYIVRFDLSTRKYFDEKVNFAKYKKYIFEQPDPARIHPAIDAYRDFSCDAEKISSELAERINSGASITDAVKNSPSVSDLYLSVGFKSVENMFLDLQMRLDSGNLVTLMHTGFKR